MMPAPTLLRGAREIGAHLGVSAKRAQHMHKSGHIPTFRKGGTPYATAGALDEWRVLAITGQLPTD